MFDIEMQKHTKSRNIDEFLQYTFHKYKGKCRKKSKMISKYKGINIVPKYGV